MVNALPQDEARVRAQRLRVLLSDVDGTLTDAGVYCSAEGEQLKRFSVRDGMGVELLAEEGIVTALVTREVSGVVRCRARKLGVRLFEGIAHKGLALAMILDELAVSAKEVAFVGDDVNDLGVMHLLGETGLTAAPSDAVAAVASFAHFVTRARGGRGAFREFADWILELRSQ